VREIDSEIGQVSFWVADGVPISTYTCATPLCTGLAFAYTPGMRKSIFFLTIPIAFAVMAIAQMSEEEYKIQMQSMGPTSLRSAR
jgi:hypothetical protein